MSFRGLFCVLANGNAMHSTKSVYGRRQKEVKFMDGSLSIDSNPPQTPLGMTWRENLQSANTKTNDLSNT